MTRVVLVALEGPNALSQSILLISKFISSLWSVRRLALPVVVRVMQIKKGWRRPVVERPCV